MDCSNLREIDYVQNTMVEHNLYMKFVRLFPVFMDGRYNSLRLKAPHAEPIILTWIFGDMLSISQGYSAFGDETAYDLTILLKVFNSGETMSAYALDILPSVQKLVTDKEEGTDYNAVHSINRFTLKWLGLIEKQGFVPVDAIMDIGVDGNLSKEGLVTDKSVKFNFDERESELLFGATYVGMFGIYQLKQDESLHDYRFTSFNDLAKAGYIVNRSNYELVYIAPLTIRDTLINLNKIYSDFNCMHPVDYKGRSVSVSDVIVLRWRKFVTAHYVDDCGFRALDSFI